MPIDMSKDSGFILWPDAYHSPALGIESANLDECVAEVKRRGLKSVFGSVPYFLETNLDFLAGLPFLEAAEFWDVTLQSLDGLYEVPSLQYLRLSGKRPPIHLQALPSLRTLNWEWRKGDEGAASLSALAELNLWRYKTINQDLEGLQLPGRLEELNLYWSNMSSLCGLPELPKLRRMEISRCRNLSSLGDLDEKCPQLEVLCISSSGRLKAQEAERVARGLPNLSLLIADKRILIDLKQEIAR